MSELPTQFMSAEQANSESAAEQIVDPELMQARIMAQTIQRFRDFRFEAFRISDVREWETTVAKIDALATKEYGKAWEILQHTDVGIIPAVVGGKAGTELSAELAAKGVQVTGYADSMLKNPDFEKNRLKVPTPHILVQLELHRLGFSDPVKTQEIYAKAAEFGFETVSPDTGPALRLHNLDRGIRFMAMEPILGPYDTLRVFCTYSLGMTSGLDAKEADPTIEWDPRDHDYLWVFSLPVDRFRNTTPLPHE